VLIFFRQYVIGVCQNVIVCQELLVISQKNRVVIQYLFYIGNSILSERIIEKVISVFPVILYGCVVIIMNQHICCIFFFRKGSNAQQSKHHMLYADLRPSVQNEISFFEFQFLRGHRIFFTEETTKNRAEKR